MNRLHILLIAACLLDISGLAHALDARGSRPCTSWMEHRAEQIDGHAMNSEIEQTWMVGYLSGVVAGSGMDFLAGTDNETIFTMTDDYCRVNPASHLAMAGTAIARALMAQKGIVNIPTLR